MRVLRFLTVVALGLALTWGSAARAEEGKAAGGDVKAAEAAKAPDKAAPDANGCCCWTKKGAEAKAGCSEMPKDVCERASKAYGNPSKWHAGACTEEDKNPK